ncbi:sugar ABC transporter substrate-binding protein [Microbacterium sp. NPDC058062]|uniref:sugar ABC transporter substrate-binding protein n=1 Tax=Microbacterium sp. NPDC058062 TaxID=3346320 RepID=UPI0036DB7B3B
MSKQILGILTATLALGLVLSGCAGVAPEGDPANSGGADSADVKAAEAVVSEYTGQPSAFPVTEPLAVLPAGARIAFMDCGSPICALFGDLIKEPAGELGMTVTSIEAGTTADGAAAAFDTVLEGGYDGVIVVGLAPSLWARELEELNAADIKIVTTGIDGIEPESVVATGHGGPGNYVGGEIMASWVVADSGGSADSVYFKTPEISASEASARGYVSQMETICPDCSVEVIDIPVSQFGAGGAQIAVDYLIANPDTRYAVFAIGEQAGGLPAAMRAADVTDVKTMLYAPDPSVLAGIKSGDFTAGVGLDLPTMVWTMVDSMARGVTDQPIDQLVLDEAIPRQILTADDLDGDLSAGWSGYPDFADRFNALWADAK